MKTFIYHLGTPPICGSKDNPDPPGMSKGNVIQCQECLKKYDEEFVKPEQEARNKGIYFGRKL